MSDPQPPSKLVELGARLRSAREAAALGAADAAERLHCDQRVVEALEAGRFDDVGPSVFVRGHLRRYADLIGLDAEKLIGDWSQSGAGQPAPPDLTRIPQAPRAADTRRLWRGAAWLAGIAVFALATWWILQRPTAIELPTLPSVQAPPATAAGTGSAPAAAVAPAPAVVPAVDRAAAGSGAPATSAGSTVAPGTAKPVPGAAAASSTRAPAASAAGTETLELRVRVIEDCWLEIYDAADQRLYYDLAAAGRSFAVRGPGPLRVLLGRISSVQLEVNGRPVRLPGVRERAQTVTFRVAADGAMTPVRRD